MKRILLVIICLSVLVSFFGCDTKLPQVTKNTSNTSNSLISEGETTITATVSSGTTTEGETTIVTTVSSETTTGIVIEGMPPRNEIEIRSLEDLEEMRAMSQCTDALILETYLHKVSSGDVSRQDLIDFLNLIDSVPYVKLLNGDITWVCYMEGESISTREYYEVFFITSQAVNGDWQRIGYHLSVSDVDAAIANFISKTEFPLQQPVQSADGRMTVYTEERTAHSSGTGEITEWLAQIDGIYASITYYSSEANAMNANDLFSSIRISTVVDK